MEFKEALKEILKIKGISVLEDQSTLKLLEDYGAFDEYPVFRSIMENIIATKIGEMLQNTFYYSVEDKGEAWSQMKKKLIEGLPYDEVFMNLFFDDLEYAFMGYAYEKGAYDRDINSDVEEMTRAVLRVKGVWVLLLRLVFTGLFAEFLIRSFANYVLSIMRNWIVRVC